MGSVVTFSDKYLATQHFSLQSLKLFLNQITGKARRTIRKLNNSFVKLLDEELAVYVNYSTIYNIRQDLF